MLTLGLAGGLDPVYEARLDAPENYTYDGAAVLAEDGVVVAAIEEGRVDRIKRSNKFPAAAIRFCLEERGVRPEDLDLIAYYAHEEAANQLLGRLYLAMPEIVPRLDARGLLAAVLGRELRAKTDPAKLRFFQHKLTHAAGALAQSGFDEALVLILDNSGGLFRGSRDDGGAIRLEEIVVMPPARSTTRLCQTLLPLLGLGPLDEQQAVAMAPLGDPASFRPAFRGFYELLPNGDYSLRLERVGQLVGKVEPRGGQGPGQQHRDLAAALQEAVEEIVLHVLRHHRAATGLRHLVLAGGIVENSRTNGKVLGSGLFEEVFAHPAVSDAGCALGAALLAAEGAGCPVPRQRVRHVHWGREVGGNAEVAAELGRWRGFLDFEQVSDVSRHTAGLLSGGDVVGWVQGRSEFSPRSLGNRSVLADPRPPGNGARIDALLCRTAGSVAIGPAVLEEAAAELFELPAGTTALPFMTFGVGVSAAGRQAVAATVHADGTAWPQTVSPETNPRLWQLVRAFGELTGVPAVLNTSFRSGAEPMVDSVEDAVVSFLTTGLEVLVVGDLVARKRTPSHADRLALRLSLPPYVRLEQSRRFVGPDRMASAWRMRATYDARLEVPVSVALYELLSGLEGEQPLAELLGKARGEGAGEDALLAEIHTLWSRRLVRLRGGST